MFVTGAQIWLSSRRRITPIPKPPRVFALSSKRTWESQCTAVYSGEACFVQLRQRSRCAMWNSPVYDLKTEGSDGGGLRFFA